MKRKLVVAASVPLVLGCSDAGPAAPRAVDAASSAVQPAAAPRNSEQVVFSGVANIASTFTNGSPVGFWVWCEAESSNPYEEECNGALYLYALGITRHVEGDVSEPSEGIYRMVVSSTRDGALVNCVLINAAEAEHGPNNRVDVSCGTPAGSAHTLGAVVNVTGPPEG